MKVIKRINNNVVLVDEIGRQTIVTGKGVGFKVYPGDEVNESFIEQRFILEEKKSSDYYVQLLKDIPMEYLNEAKKIVDMAKSEIKNPISSNAVFALADHLYFAKQRQEQGMLIEHPLSWEIRLYYPREYELGKQAVELLREHMGLALPDGEAVMIAMHFVNCAGGLSNEYDIAQLTEIMREVITLIENTMQFSIDETSAAFTRFVTHLRYYLIRQLKMEIDDSINVELLEIVREKYPSAYDCARKVADYLERKYGNQTSDSELLYLTLHINCLISKNKAKEETW